VAQSIVRPGTLAWPRSTCARTSQATILREQTGYTGDEAEWRHARSLVADALPRSDRFLDVGCAGGLLMESVQTWCAERGVSIEPYGREIAPEWLALGHAGTRRLRFPVERSRPASSEHPRLGLAQSVDLSKVPYATLARLRRGVRKLPLLSRA